MNTDSKPTILILCTGNSCRSHIGEGFLRAALGDRANVQSAGSKPAGFVHPLAIQVMAEVGIDISRHESKHLKTFLDQRVDTVITVCGNADQACPIFPGQLNRHHWPFYDPAKAARKKSGNASAPSATRCAGYLKRMRPGGTTPPARDAQSEGGILSAGSAIG
jgi:arsenate reductase